MSFIEIKNAVKIYNANKGSETVALNAVNFSADLGESIAIMGVSGSGKTTLLNILGCLDFLTDGEYIFNGVDVESLSATQMAKMRNQDLGFVLQDYALILENNIRDNLALPLYLSGNFPKKEVDSKICNTLKLVGLGEEFSAGLKKKVGDMSGGQRQRVAIARAIINNPKVILADEPTGALDSKTANEVVDTLVGLVNENNLLIMVTHDLNMAKKCKRIINLKDGKIETDE